MRAKVFGFCIRIALSLTLLYLLIFGTAGRASAGSIIYVNLNATGANNGTSWANAFKGLQKALSVATNGDQIWVAKGIYKPGKVRTATFNMPIGVGIYGGFAGTESKLIQRKPGVNITILSGEIGAAGLSDNIYHVVTCGGTLSTGILDGFTIMAGSASDSSPNDKGGGIYCITSYPTLRNLVIAHNYATTSGGGMYSYNGNPTLSNVKFNFNSVSNTGGGGGGFYTDSGSPVLTKVAFNNNTAAFAGGMFDTVGTPILKNVRFMNNHSAGGGALYNSNSSPTITGAIFGTNRSTNGGGAIDNHLGATLTLTNAIFVGNEATNFGGAILNFGDVEMTNAMFQFNSAGLYGGGVLNEGSSTANLTNATFVGNKSQYGGAIVNYDSNTTITNVTASGNTASISGGAVYNYLNAPVINDSIFWNDGLTEVASDSTSIVISDSVVKGSCPLNATCNNVSSADPKLGPLQNNGGLTPTMALGAGSSALDKGNTATCASKDQRGVSRPQGVSCDAGAFEVKAMGFVSQAPFDGQVMEQAAGTNIGGPVANNNYIFVGDYPSNQRLHGLLSFDTSALPDTGTFLAAKLRVEQLSAPTGNPFGTAGKLVADLAKPYFGSGVGLESVDYQAPATLSQAGIFNPVPSNGWYTTQLGPTARSDINRIGITQFRLRFTVENLNNTADYIIFLSGDVPTAPDRPMLFVYYGP